LSSGDTFGARSTLEVGGESYEIFRLDALQEKYYRHDGILHYVLRELR
jgi:hypothetical protein